ncbi:hypothetical protein Cs7R123_13190 [Catellatospora sp. TT07R-123]|uniref:hypothetical protein n=1 Tax=Catellatospora sp. TT07R-123 TaxID=2733863 RepID=UPI001B1A6713|nr:hypothetical protein [Catellatospora sp. TT07R-123]GHJ43977.1 hypothetical protein Cs7R123_13190 [Catellatospora sp. TT07R-123]
MILLGLLLVLGLSGLALTAFLTNDGLFTTPVGAVELFGYHAEPTVGQVFSVGAAAGALVLIGLMMMFGGAGRRARRRVASRREQQAQRAELRDLQRRHDSIQSELAAKRSEDAADSAERADADAEAEKVAVR